MQLSTFGLRSRSQAAEGIRRIVEIFVIIAKAEQALRVPCSRGLFEVAEGAAGVVLDVIRVRTRQ